MPSKLSSSKSEKKGDGPKRSSGRGSTRSSTTSRTGPSTRSGAGGTSARSKPTSEEPAAKKAPAKRAEAVSLIGDDKKPERKPATASQKQKSVLPPISRIQRRTPATEAPPEPAKPPAPEKKEVKALNLIDEQPKRPKAEPPKPAEPEEAVAEEQEAPVAAEAAEDAKVILAKTPIIVKELADQLGLRPYQVISDLMELNIFAAIDQALEPDIAAKVCEKHGYIFEKERRKTGEGVHKQEVDLAPPPEPEPAPEMELRPRAPIITFMGHVDHGKTSLMDYIRKARVAKGEAGGITQHIGAYSVEHKGQRITFIDTPGHAAFTAMRARGADVTDIVVIVIAADDGVMPQTREAINHAKAAGVTIMVAINKIDLPSANLDRVKTQLQELDLAPEDWGGDTICIPVSATKGTGVDELLEMMSLQAEVLELKGDQQAEARCTVIEAQSEQGRGHTASVIVKMGTLKIGQPFICGNYWGKVKQLTNDVGQQVKEVPPGAPVKVLGFGGLPKAGDELIVMPSEKAAKALSEERLEAERREKLTAPKRATLESLFAASGPNSGKKLKVVIKGDAQGSVEAICQSLGDIKSDKIELNILHSAVGPITESDVLLASASDAIIIGFNTKTENTAAAAAKREGVQIKLFSIIYELLDQVREAMTGMLEPETRETIIGHAEVKQVFALSRGKVGGSMVQDGRISRSARARVLRGKQPIYDGGIATLRRFQDEVKEVRAGLECGIKLGDFSDYEVGDIIECYELEKVPQTL